MHCLFILLIALVLSPGMRATEVVALLSSDAKPYTDAESAAQEKLGKKGVKIKSVQLKNLTEDSIKEWQQKPPAGILAIGTEAAQALHTRDGIEAPAFFCMVADAEGQGLTSGRPMQGVTIDVPVSEQIALIDQALPKARNIGVLYRSKSDKSQKPLQAIQSSALSKYKIITVDMDRHESESSAIDTLIALKPDVVWTFPDPAVYNSNVVRALLLAALRVKIPVFGYSRPFVKAGALLGVGINPRTQGEQAADLILRYQDGRGKAPEGFTPLAQLEAPKFEVSINTTVADKLSIRLPEVLVKRADEAGGGD